MRKIVILAFTVCCIVAVFVTCIVPVAADDVTPVYVQSFMDFYDGYTGVVDPSEVGDVAFVFGSSYDDVITTLNTSNFYSLTLGNYDYIERDLNENSYYEYAAYSFNEEDITTSVFGCFSYCFFDDRVTLPWVGDYYTYLVMNYMSLQFYGCNVAIDGIRFSLRSLSDDYVTSVSLYSDTFEVDFKTSEDISNRRYFYYTGIDAVSTIKFGSGTGVDFVPPAYAFCIDFFFRPISHRDLDNSVVAIGIDTDSSFNLLNYVHTDTDVVGPTTAYYPELTFPYYSGPNHDSFNKLYQAEAEALMNFDTASFELSNLLSEFATGFPKFATVLSRISDIFNYSTLSIPILSTVVITSLSLGLFAFVLGLSKSIFGARVTPDADNLRRDKSGRSNSTEGE